MKIKAVVRTENGLWHALTWSQADAYAVCGLELHNFNKRVGLANYKCKHCEYEYVPPKNLFPTCLVCVAIATR